VKVYAVHKYIRVRRNAMSPVEISNPQKRPDRESTGSHKVEIPDANMIMDSRLPYNMERVVCSLLQIMVARGLLTLNEARQISRTGESYLH
jgi:hypothetical protein